MSDPIPVTVVGGYLGAGKTTLLNHLLRHAAGLRIAVLVNDFGELPIDADLIEAQDGDVISIAGGCVCCSFGSDLVAALMRLPERSPRPEQVLVETSGVALPASVARSVALLPAFRRDATVVLADAENVRARAADRYVGDTVTRQLAEADLILLNKCDLASPSAIAQLTPWLREQAPQARVIHAQRSAVPPEVLLGVSAARASQTTSVWLRSGAAGKLAPPPASTSFESVALRPDTTLDAAALAAALADPALGLLRAKGVLQDRDGGWWALQVVGSRWDVSRVTRAPASSALVCIGVAGRIGVQAVAAAVASAATSTRASL